jgi:hypothetical protein
MKAAISVVHKREKVGPRSSYAIQTKPQDASGGEGRAFWPAPIAFSLATEAKS